MISSPHMPVHSGYHRGHRISLCDGVWLYDDTRAPVADDPERPCGHCKKANRIDGHDACLGHIPGAINACCGHGHSTGYVQWGPSVHHCTDCLSRRGAIVLVTPRERVCRVCGNEPGEQFTREEIKSVLDERKKEEVPL